MFAIAMDLREDAEIANELINVVPVGCATKILVVFLYLVAFGLGVLGVGTLISGESSGAWIVLGTALGIAVLTSPFLIMWVRRSKAANPKS
jgi:hypothetical protein